MAVISRGFSGRRNADSNHGGQPSPSRCRGRSHRGGRRRSNEGVVFLRSARLGAGGEALLKVTEYWLVRCVSGGPFEVR